MRMLNEVAFNKNYAPQVTLPDGTTWTLRTSPAPRMYSTFNIGLTEPLLPPTAVTVPLTITIPTLYNNIIRQEVDRLRRHAWARSDLNPNETWLRHHTRRTEAT